MNYIVSMIVDALGRHVAWAADPVAPVQPSLQVPKLTNLLCADPAKTCIDSLPAFIEMILKFIVDAGTPLVAIAFIWTGLQYVLAQGNPEKLTKAHKTAKYTLIGSALILGSFVVTKIITSTIGEVIN